MGATFASDEPIRLFVQGKAYSGANKSLNGITGPAVSIIARHPMAAFGKDRFESFGMRVYLSMDDLWKNRVEDASGWFFTRSRNAYAAIRIAGAGYTTSDEDLARIDKKLVEQKIEHGVFLDFKDMWAPVVIQMGRAADDKSFEDFCTAVKANRFEYQDGKLTYTSAAKDTYEYWSNIMTLPRINGTVVNLNPPKNFNSPFLSMEHGSSKAVIRYPGHEDFVVDFK